MNHTGRVVLSVAGRVMLALIFLMSAVGNKIPNFSGVAGYMGSVGVPAPQIMLAGAIVFLIVGSLSVITGYRIEIGAGLSGAGDLLLSRFLESGRSRPGSTDDPVHEKSGPDGEHAVSDR